MRPGSVIGLVLCIFVLGVGGGVLGSWLLRPNQVGPAPELARGMMPWIGAVSPPWTARLQRKFPVGMQEKAMMAELTHQGFTVDSVRHSAGYGWEVTPCVFTLTVEWRADDRGRVRIVQGGLRNACTDAAKLTPERPPARRGRTAPAPQPALPTIDGARGQPA